MKVFILYDEEYACPYPILGVFSTLDAARAAYAADPSVPQAEAWTAGQAGIGPRFAIYEEVLDQTDKTRVEPVHHTVKP